MAKCVINGVSYKRHLFNSDGVCSRCGFETEINFFPGRKPYTRIRGSVAPVGDEALVIEKEEVTQGNKNHAEGCACLDCRFGIVQEV